jgi:hypothetical protein
MKTLTEDYRKEIKATMKQINKCLADIENAEKTQNECSNNRDFSIAEHNAQDAAFEIMIQLKKAVRLASTLGFAHNAFESRTAHKVIEYKL